VNKYVVLGDIDGSFKVDFEATQTQNFDDGIVADGRSGILRITQTVILCRISSQPKIVVMYNTSIM
jgi:hypothetical protein